MGEFTEKNVSTAETDVTMSYFSTEYLDKAEKIFFRPHERYSWPQIVSGVLGAVYKVIDA